MLPLPYHPCMDDEAHGKVARIHLPVAPRCNLACAYCERILSSDPRDPGPGTTARVISPEEGVARAVAFLNEYGKGSIVGIAGPGDPLANEATFTCLSRLKSIEPDARTCLCTNGLALPESVDRLIELGIGTLTVTVNGVSPETVALMQPRVVDRGVCRTGQDGAQLLLERQREGIRRAVDGGIVVKVNMVVTPQVNMREAGAVAEMAARLGARVFNPMPLIPRNGLRDMRRPTSQEMAEVREQGGNWLSVFSKCKQCRADAVGIPGKEGTGCQMKKTC
ncbi:radical SAM protein [Salidesulfovibrio onnuriiensis]|uniref:radical SAM protein n=1 Tax=Salidesulfovibrio onnuriiensis TaxID=2583823 RepID=UPI0016506EC8|nr:radical SAM protein [Salidesulfovibrio onnuriiensis]